MTTNQQEIRRAIQVSGLMKENQRLLCDLESIKHDMKRWADKAKEVQQREMTGWFVLLDRDGDGWKVLGIVNPERDEDIPDGWMLSLPIPEPATVPEFWGW